MLECFALPSRGQYSIFAKIVTGLRSQASNTCGRAAPTLPHTSLTNDSPLCRTILV